MTPAERDALYTQNAAAWLALRLYLARTKCPANATRTVSRTDSAAEHAKKIKTNLNP